MSLQIRGRPDYDPAVRLGLVETAYLREVKRNTSISDAEDVEFTSEVPISSLPILATANDARELVRFLKKRPNGVTVVEAMNAEPRRIFDARKIAAYEFWGIIYRENERLMLTRLGKELADALEPECQMHRSILHRISAYKIAVKCIYDEGLDIATHLDVLRCWSELKSEVLAEYRNPQDMEAAVVCFFSLCHAADLGTSTVGKRGQPARLRVDMEQVAAFLSEELDGEVNNPSPRKPKLVRHTPSASDGTIRQVLISTSGPVQNVQQLASLLALAGFESRTLDFSDLENGLLHTSELNEMQQCQAGIFVISPADCIKKKDGTFSLRHEWITKISVAAALFDWRILLFWNGKLPPPEELTANGLTILSNEDFSWDTCLELANQIKGFAFSVNN